MAKRPGSRKPAKAPNAVSLSGFYRHFDVEECLCFFATALARAGLNVGALEPYQHTLYDDLHDPLDEETLAEMLSYWDYDLSRLVDRGRRSGPNTPAKPRIDVLVEMTSRGNLKAEWFPHGAGRSGNLPAASDFTWFRRYDHRGQGYDTRPNNELFFLRGAESALLDLDCSEYPFPVALNHVLLAACAKVVERLKKRLNHHFEVTMLYDVFVEWEDLSGDHWSIPAEYHIVKWQLDDPAVRQRQAELIELADLAKVHGFSEQALRDAVATIRERDRQSSVPSAPHNYVDRLSKELKKKGLPATPKKVERALYLIERHRPIQLVERRVPANVVSFPEVGRADEPG